MEQEPKLLIGMNGLIRRGTFEIHEYEGDAEEGSIVVERKGSLLFKNDGGLANDFASVGIIYRQLCGGKKTMLVRNPDDKFHLIEK